MAAVRTILLTGDSVPIDPSDFTDLPIWSVLEYGAAPAADPLKAFSYAKGDDVPGAIDPLTLGPRKATELDTNMLVGGRFHDTEGMKIMSIGIEWFSVGNYTGADPGYDTDRPWISALDLKRCFRDVVGELTMTTDVAVVQAPIGYFPSGWDVINATSGARLQEGPLALKGTLPLTWGMAGVPELRGHVIWALNFKVNPTTQIAFNHRFPRGGVVADLSRTVQARNYLHGPRRRAIV